MGFHEINDRIHVFFCKVWHLVHGAKLMAAYQNGIIISLFLCICMGN